MSYLSCGHNYRRLGSPVSLQQQGPLEDWYEWCALTPAPCLARMAYRAALLRGCCVRYTGVKATFLSMLDAVGDAEERMEAAQDSVSEAALVLCVLRLTCGYPPPSASSALHST